MHAHGTSPLTHLEDIESHHKDRSCDAQVDTRALRRPLLANCHSRHSPSCLGPLPASSGATSRLKPHSAIEKTGNARHWCVCFRDRCLTPALSSHES